MRLYDHGKHSFFVFHSIPMKLMMYIGNDLIEAVPLETDRISKPGYLGQFKRTLKLKYNDLIQQYAEKPDFLVVNLSTTEGVNR